jgi:hypothetical protein
MRRQAAIEGLGGLRVSNYSCKDAVNEGLLVLLLPDHASFANYCKGETSDTHLRLERALHKLIYRGRRIYG